MAALAAFWECGRYEIRWLCLARSFLRIVVLSCGWPQLQSSLCLSLTHPMSSCLPPRAWNPESHQTETQRALQTRMSPDTVQQIGSSGPSADHSHFVIAGATGRREHSLGVPRLLEAFTKEASRRRCENARVTPGRLARAAWLGVGGNDRRQQLRVLDLSKSAARLPSPQRHPQPRHSALQVVTPRKF